LMERQLDAPAAALLKRALHRRKVKVLLEKQTLAVTGEERVSGLAFADGTALPAESVVCAVGIKPNAALAKSAGLTTNRGIVVDDAMAASLPGFYAIGECAEHRGIAYGLIEPAYAQAETLAANLCGEPRTFEGMVLSTNLKVSGVPVFSAGEFMGNDNTVSAVVEDRHSGMYRKLVFEDSHLEACVLVGDAEDGLWYLDLIRRKVNIAAARSALLHGRAYAEPLLSPSVSTPPNPGLSLETAA